MCLSLLDAISIYTGSCLGSNVTGFVDIIQSKSIDVVSRNITDFIGKRNWCQSIVGRLNGSLELILGLEPPSISLHVSVINTYEARKWFMKGYVFFINILQLDMLSSVVPIGVQLIVRQLSPSKLILLCNKHQYVYMEYKDSDVYGV